MKTQNLESIVREHRFFAGLGEARVALMAGCAKNVRFEEGAVLARQGDAADEFYLIREGRVGIGFPVPQGGWLAVQTLDEGDIVGWSWLMPPHVWQFDVTAVTRVRAIAIDGKCLRGKCEVDTDLGYELMKRFSHAMVQRLQATRLQLVDMYRNEHGGGGVAR